MPQESADHHRGAEAARRRAGRGRRRRRERGARGSPSSAPRPSAPRGSARSSGRELSRRTGRLARPARRVRPTAARRRSRSAPGRALGGGGAPRGGRGAVASLAPRASAGRPGRARCSRSQDFDIRAPPLQGLGLAALWAFGWWVARRRERASAVPGRAPREIAGVTRRCCTARVQWPGFRVQRRACTAGQGRRRAADPEARWASTSSSSRCSSPSRAPRRLARARVESGLRLVGWIAGYAAAVYAARRLGRRPGRAARRAPRLGRDPARRHRRLPRRRRPPSRVAIAARAPQAPRRATSSARADRVLGASFGAARGALVVVLLGWLGALRRGALRAQGVAASPAVGESLARARVGARRRARRRRAARPRGGRARASRPRSSARPRETIEALRGVLEHPRFAALQNDAAFWGAVEAGDLDAALALPSFRALVADAALRARARAASAS